MQTLQKICLALTIVGALNWCLVGLFTKVIYSFVGLAGIINIGLLLTPFEKNIK